MKPKMLLMYGCAPDNAIPLAKALEKYFDLTAYCMFDDKDINMFDKNLPQIKILDPGAYVNIVDFDVYFGLDPSALVDLIKVKKNSDRLVGCNILDFPDHVFAPSRNYNYSLKHRWQTWYREYREMDFITSWKENALTIFQDLKIPKLSLFGPANPMFLEDKFEQKYQICYSGTIKPDKGVHNIIEAISLLHKRPEFIVIGSGSDLTKYAEYMQVTYKVKPVDKLEKYKIYNESICTVCFPDNPWITPLCILEGIAIGKTGVVANWPENRQYFKDYAVYAEPFNLKDLSDKIAFVVNNPSVIEEKMVGAKDFFIKERSNEKWAEDFYNFLSSNKLV